MARGRRVALTPAFWANPFSAGQPRQSRAGLTPPSAEAWEIGEVVRLVSGPGSGPTRAGRHWWGGLNPEGSVQTGHPTVLSFRPLGVRRVQAWSWGNNFQLWLNRLAAPRTRSCAQPPPAMLDELLLRLGSITEPVLLMLVGLGLGGRVSSVLPCRKTSHTSLWHPLFLHLSLSLVVDTRESLGEWGMGTPRGSMKEKGGSPEWVFMAPTVRRRKKSSEKLGTLSPGSGDLQTGKWSLEEQIPCSEVA